ncbi:RecQ family ATP-dependent DNA helicase [Flavihumibacter cheonanensis]|uniref:RecQ family ATP-dependent DNA helicase n=1 Tax=Flavihumibacter cheonanensis TaxID=1442385 RepID=UPI001EF79376|nr:ATP-dependent DNA helicase RecQ [Flavihumibacter cheonanensis]MCG7753650.1 RecQ family ATP-dependent DNA helicase [Flavihumibacter cheonanensis]
MQQDIHSILKQYWGHSEFRPLQEEIIRTALEKQDCLALLPTGSGKSVCFQVPALAMEGICLVISPLIALMKDQVAQLRKKGISALAIHTGMPYKEVNKTLQLALNGQIKFLYLSPERLQTNLFKEYLPVLPVTLIAVDEAHCVSQWGYDFRPQYLQIASLREILPEVPILALTASATPLVQEDIMTQLQLKKAVVHKGSFIREALSYSCFEESSKLPKLFDIISKVEGSSIVYCRSRKRTVDICRFLNERGISATYYHAGLNQEERNERQQQWTQNQVRIIVSTNAFGMGIDKPDVRTVVHYDVPDCLENYYQEAGRAGRDRQKAYAVLLYNQQDLTEVEQQLEKKFPDMETIKKVYQAMANFLHLPTGTGEGQSFDFDLTLFCKNFDLDRMVAINALQLLQANGYCALNESVYEPARVQFVADRSWLEQVEKNYPALEPLIKTLLRTIEGIFSYPGMISETYLARLLRTERENIINQLKQLESLGIVNYEQARDQPQLVLLTERVKTENIQLDLKAIERRKKIAKERLDALFQYTIGNTCRSSFIGRYFGDAAIKDCGICDNCLEKKRKAAKPQQLQNKILNSLENGAKSITTLQAEIGNNANQQELLGVIRLLESEQLIRVQISGMVERL